jgi:TonB family protein
MPTAVRYALLLLVAPVAFAAEPPQALPQSIIIARHSFIDVGPPFDFYEVIRVKEESGHLTVERSLVTPGGDFCTAAPSSVEYSSGELNESMVQLLRGKNPCDIPEKDLHKELKHRKHYSVFSGADVTMQVQCTTGPRRIRMDILDRDLFDPAPGTPPNTSWTMEVLADLDKVIGQGVWDKPMFPTIAAPQPPVPETDLVHEIRVGKFDDFFDKRQPISEIVLDAEKPAQPPPAVSIESIMPAAPMTPRLPVYPPIAKAARVQGEVEATFDIRANGTVANLAVVSGPKMLQQAVSVAIQEWTFPPESWGKVGQAKILFNLNCPPDKH